LLIATSFVIAVVLTLTRDQVTIPGDSFCELSVMDQDLVGSDELIGSTRIDIENRWLSEKWKVNSPAATVLCPVRNMVTTGDAQKADRSSSIVRSQQPNVGAANVATCSPRSCVC
jgi:hypothetical protein